MKQCTRCKKNKNKSEFGKHSLAKDGLRPDCKECKKELNKKVYQNVVKVKTTDAGIHTDEKRSKIDFCGDLTPILTKLGYSSSDIDELDGELYEKYGKDVISKCPYASMCDTFCLGRPFPKLENHTFHEIKQIIPNLVASDYRKQGGYRANVLMCDDCQLRPNCTSLCKSMTSFMDKENVQQYDGYPVDALDQPINRVFDLGYIGEVETSDSIESWKSKNLISEDTEFTTSPYPEVIMGQAIKGDRTIDQGRIYKAITPSGHNFTVSRQDIQWRVLDDDEREVIYCRIVKFMYVDAVCAELDIVKTTFVKRIESAIKKLRDAHADENQREMHKVMRKLVISEYSNGISINAIVKKLGINKFTVERYLDSLFNK